MFCILRLSQRHTSPLIFCLTLALTSGCTTFAPMEPHPYGTNYQTNRPTVPPVENLNVEPGQPDTVPEDMSEPPEIDSPPAPQLHPENDPEDKSDNVEIPFGSMSNKPHTFAEPDERTTQKSKTPRIELQGPEMIPEDVLPDNAPTLKVKYPGKLLVGAAATFQIEVTNPTNKEMTNLVIESEFSAGLVFPGHSDKRVRQTIETIPAGGRHELALTLIGVAPGRLCCHLDLRQDGQLAASYNACVEYERSDIDLQMSAPKIRTVGQKVEFVMLIVNRSDEEQTDVQAEVTFDVALIPLEATANAQRQENRLSWSLGKMAAGEGVAIQVEFQCQTRADEACVRFHVTSNETTPEAIANCVKIADPDGPLEIELIDDKDPISVGSTADYKLTLSNSNKEFVKDIKITALLPDGLQPTNAEVHLDDQLIDLPFQIRGQQMRFQTIDLIRRREEMRVTIRAKAIDSGVQTFRCRIEYEGTNSLREVGETTFVTK